MGEISGKVAMLDDQREGLAFGLLRNGITDVNTGKKDQVEGAKQAIQELIDKVNLRFYTNDYQHIADGSIWLHQAWGGDMTAIGYYLPKGTPVTAVSYWWPQDGRGLMGNDTMAVLKGAPHPVLAHLFLDHVLDTEEAFLNMEFTGYQQPLARNDAGGGGRRRTRPRKPALGDRPPGPVREGLPAGPALGRRHGDLGNRLVGNQGDVRARWTPVRNDGAIWRDYAIPGVVWLILFVVVPAYAVLAVSMGQVNFLFQPVPQWNPADWNPGFVNKAFSSSSPAATTGPRPATP